MPCLYLLIAWLLSLIFPSDELQYLDFDVNGSLAGSMVVGDLPSGMDHAILTNDDKANLPDQFTICSSIYNAHFVTTQGFFQLMREDGSTWINLLHWSMKVNLTQHSYQQFRPVMIINQDYFQLMDYDYDVG